MQLNICWKFVIFFIFLLLDEVFMNEIHPEEPCSRTGGICTLKDDCSNRIPIRYIGLCPQQQNQGVECCHGSPNSETRCRRLGGECQPEKCARDFLKVRRATDCEAGESCCLLLRYV